MTETVFAGENVKEFSLQDIFAVLAFIDTNLAPFAENLFLRDRPGHRRDRQGKDQQPKDLFDQDHNED